MSSCTFTDNSWRMVARIPIQVTIKALEFSDLFRFLLLTLAFFFGNIGSGLAQSYEDGYEAFLAEDYETALSTLLPLAEKGQARSQAVVGFMYLQGLGVAADPETAARWYVSSADQGDARAQYILALMYDEGTGVPLRPDEALRFLRLSAEQENVDAQFALGAALYFAQDQTRNVQEALRWWSLAADQGHPVAQFNMAETYRQGVEIPEDIERAVQLYEASAEQDYALAQHMLGLLFQAGYGVAQDDVLAAEWYLRAAEQGHADAQYQLAYMHSQGSGMPVSWPQAVEWYLLAAEQGMAEAQFALGYIFRFGQEGVPEDRARAFFWYLKAAEQGDASSQEGAAFAYEYGQGAEQDYEKAAYWYRQAADQGVGSAQYSLGRLYRDGKGVGKNTSLAIDWFRQSADQGVLSAQTVLGFMYYHGRGVPVDYAEAARFYEMAAEQGDAQSQSLIGFMYESGRGVGQDLAQAQKWYALAQEQEQGMPAEKALAHWQVEYANAQRDHGAVSAEVLKPLEEIMDILFRDFGFARETRDTAKLGYEISEKINGPAHKTTLLFLGGYAANESLGGNLNVALELARDLLVRKQDVYGATHEETLTTTGLVARILEQRGDITEANQVLQEGLTIALEVHGPDAWIVTSNLGTQVMTVNTDDASPALLSSLRNYAADTEADLGSSSLKTLEIKGKYAKAVAEIGDHLQATEVWADILRGQEERLLLAAVLDSATRGAVIRDAKAAGREMIRQARAAQISLQDAEGPFRFEGEDYAYDTLKNQLASATFYAAQLGETGAADAVARSMARLTLRDAGLQQAFSKYEAAQETVLRLGEDIAQLVAGRGGTDAVTDGRLLDLQSRRADTVATVRNILAEIETDFPRVSEIMAPQPISIREVTTDGEESSLLGPNEALILMVPPQEGANGVVWAVSRENFTWAEIDRSQSELRADIQYLHALLDPAASESVVHAAAVDRGSFSLNETQSNTDGRAFDRAFAYDLYSALLGDQGIQDVIAEKSEWIIAPQGMLLSLPFATLVMDTPEGGTARDADPAVLRNTPWLGTRRALSIIPAVSSLRALRRADVERNTAEEIPFFGLGDPVFASVSTQVASANIGVAQNYLRSGVADADEIANLSQLPGTRVEIERLAAAFGADRNAVLLGKDASESGLAIAHQSGVLPSSRVIVLATHGLMAGAFETLGEPALAMTPPECGAQILDPGLTANPSHQNCTPAGPRAELEAAAKRGAWIDDGLLTASEVTLLDLDADWVILSACDTAAGSDQSPDAEGLSGLARSFFFAGARSLLVSHWPVRDDVAAILTPAAVARAQDANLSRAEALRQSMIMVMENTQLDATSRSYAHPAAWAPFQVTGVNPKGS